MKTIHVVAAVVALGWLGVGLAADPQPTPAPADSTDLVFPAIPGIPPPAVGDVPTLVPGQFFVVTSDSKFYLLASPRALVTVTYEEGPIKLRGVFADGSGRVETRKYDAKYLAIVDAVPGASGRIELIGVPSAVTTESDITRRLVDIGVAPQPPPGPGPGPGPNPPNPPYPPVPPVPAPVGLRVLLIYETSADNTREQLNVIYSPGVRDWLNANCAKSANGKPEWRRWDPDIVVTDGESKDLRDLWTASKPEVAKGKLPQIVIARNGAAKVYPLPTTESEALTLLKGM